MITRRGLVNFEVQISNFGETCTELVNAAEELISRIEELEGENAGLISRIEELEDEQD